MNTTTIRSVCVSASACLIAMTGALMAQQNAAPSDTGITTLHVQGNVYMLQGAGGNVAVQIGDMGIAVVDTGLERDADKLLAAIRKLSDKPILHIVNTNAAADHTGGNAAVRRAGTTIAGANLARDLTDASRGAQIVAHENALNRMSAPTGKVAPVPAEAWPTMTYVSGQKEMHFNHEPIVIRWQPAAITDGDSLVFFRHSDVVVAGDIFDMTSYPAIDLERGGSIQGEVDALNNLLDIVIPEHEQEGGTYIIPGHGRICDEADLLDYRDTVTIIRDRVQWAMKKGMSLEQIKSAGLTKDFDGRWSAKQGLGTADNFITAVYKSLGAQK
jgi:glyoxylase-like metal-dependent hydrolase (beta-lactamase superfamily II)